MVKAMKLPCERRTHSGFQPFKHIFSLSLSLPLSLSCSLSFPQPLFSPSLFQSLSLFHSTPLSFPLSFILPLFPRFSNTLCSHSSLSRRVRRRDEKGEIEYKLYVVVLYAGVLSSAHSVKPSCKPSTLMGSCAVLWIYLRWVSRESQSLKVPMLVWNPPPTSKFLDK